MVTSATMSSSGRSWSSKRRQPIGDDAMKKEPRSLNSGVFFFGAAAEVIIEDCFGARQSETDNSAGTQVTD